MCGIFGCFSLGGLGDNLHALIRANDVAAHRGPDGARVVWFDTRANTKSSHVFQHDTWLANEPPTLVFGHRRLAIIDLSDRARQPMSNDDGSMWIIFNGELYNFVELRKELEALGAVFRTTSDTEVVLKAYEAWGFEAFSRFLGMWAIAILDRKARRLLLSRDRFGIKPLHYFSHAGVFAFASEIKQLLTLPTVPRQINERVVYDYLKYEAADSGPDTFFAGVYKLRPGYNLSIRLDDGEVNERCYYVPLAANQLNDADAANAAERFRELLKDSVRIHMRSDVPVGTCLSGGLDSSSIAMLMREVAIDEGMDVKRHSFSCHFDTPEANELEYTLQSIKAAAVIPHIVEPNEYDLCDDLRKLVWHQDEPFGSTSIYAQWCVFRLIKQTGVKVVLDGQGADEMLGGYASTIPHFLLEQIARGRVLKAVWESWRWARLQGTPWRTQVPIAGVRRALSLLAHRERSAPPPDPSWLDPEFETLHAASSQHVKNLSNQPFGRDGHFSNVLYQFFFLNNLPALLRYEDRNSMAFSVEARVPFLDHRLVDFAFSLPIGTKVRNGYTKHILREAMTNTLPQKIRLRARKMGFASPERRWQTGPLRSLVMEAIEGDRLKPYIERRVALQHFKRVCEDNLLSFAPWRWLNLSLWMQEFAVA